MEITKTTIKSFSLQSAVNYCGNAKIIFENLRADVSK